MYNASELML